MPSENPQHMFPYQETGAAFLASRVHKTAALYDDMRLGKTRQILKAMRLLGAETVAVAAKASGVYVWEADALEWGFNPLVLSGKDRPQKGRVNIVSYGLLAGSRHDAMTALKYDVVNGDEIDACKNRKAKRTKAFYGPSLDRRGGLASCSDTVWVDTGTPAPNHPAELWTTLHALAPETILRGGRPMDYWRFVSRYCQTRDNGFGTQIIGGKNLAELRTNMAPWMLRRKKSEVWQNWKEPSLSVLPVQGHVAGVPGAEMDVVRAALKTNDIASALKEAASSAPTLRRLTGLAKVDGTLAWAKDNVDTAGKVNLFAYHREVIELLRSGLPGKHVAIVGGMSSDEKRNAYTAFQEDPSIQWFVGQNQAARDSIPLWKASTTLLVEPEWVPGDNSQILARMDHVSKKAPLSGYLVAVHGSIDEDIMRALARKKEISEGLGL